MKQTRQNAALFKGRENACGGGIVKKSLSILLAICMLLSITAGLNLTVYADTDGYYTYEINDIGVTITAVDSSISGDITIPSELGGYYVNRIGDEAFSHCTSLTSVTIPDKVVSIGDEAFSYCTSLTSVTIPRNVRSIGNYVFKYCTSLTSINVNSSNNFYTSQDGVLFNKDKTELIQYPIGNTRSDYIMPNSVTSIDAFAFYFSTSLSSVSIGNSVTKIGNYAFYFCKNLKNIAIGNNVKTIGDWAFDDCKNLKSIIIPSSIESIGAWAFRGCTGISDVYYYDTIARWNSISVGSGNKNLSSAIIHCTDGILNECSHSYDNGTVTKAATCTKTGKKVYTCTECGETKTESIPATGHKTKVVTTEATYAKAGKEETKCTVCGKVISTKKLPKLTVPNITLSSVKSKKSKQITVTWQKNTKVTGYEIQYSTDKNFKKSVKKATIKKNKTTSTTLKKLKGNKKYYVRIRAYKTENGKKYYSAWSKAKSVTTKK